MGLSRRLACRPCSPLAFGGRGVWYHLLCMPERRQVGSSRDSQSVQTSGRTARSGGRAQRGGGAVPERRPKTEEREPPSSAAPVKAWIDANLAPSPGSGRDPFRIAA